MTAPPPTGFLPPETTRPGRSRFAGALILTSLVPLLVALYVVPLTQSGPTPMATGYFKALGEVGPEVILDAPNLSLSFLAMIPILVSGIVGLASGSKGANIFAGIGAILASFLVFSGFLALIIQVMTLGVDIGTLFSLMGIGFYLLWVTSVLILVFGVLAFVGAGKAGKAGLGGPLPMGPGMSGPPPMGPPMGQQPPMGPPSYGPPGQAPYPR